MPCHFVKKNRPFPVKMTICSPHALWYHRKKGIVFQKGGFIMKSIAGVLAVTLNLLILTLIWGFSARLHRCTCRHIHARGISVSAHSADCAGHWVYDCGACAHLSTGTVRLFPFQQQRKIIKS